MSQAAGVMAPLLRSRELLLLTGCMGDREKADVDAAAAAAAGAAEGAAAEDRVGRDSLEAHCMEGRGKEEKRGGGGREGGGTPSSAPLSPLALPAPSTPEGTYRNLGYRNRTGSLGQITGLEDDEGLKSVNMGYFRPRENSVAAQLAQVNFIVVCAQYYDNSQSSPTITTPHTHVIRLP
ncbi:hypothetical protein PRIPAC_91532 [Pristionchus pacificus]|uniref:Uncharacterized protein n=1 Tax=Pristionchus pacificus TaxID=54126 RepID=A0A2A6CHC7_PRIPA|nr:hypothetical protein PRIPAC_91532 [Pristionchus pacificus]|eukprot:PDM77490.1 hypothetical protein PRIPAC_34357 [Pristionchus pacificus]